ncbi:MAG: pullulanase-type alpha-1,6-glucosidase [Chloroflexota bacterium]
MISSLRLRFLGFALLAIFLSTTAVSTAAQTDDETTIPAPQSVTIAGTLQPEAGCAGEWDPTCAESQLVYDSSDDLWSATFDLPAGNYEYKAALNESWDDNYGLNTEYYGSNILLAVEEDGPITFWYDHKTRWVSDSINSIVANVPGDFQEEIGCPGDWQPDCLRSLLQDPNGDGIYTFITALIPAGDYEAKVAEDQAWTINYGQNGEQDGANIPFSVGENQATIFNFDPQTGILTIETTDDVPSGLITALDQVQSDGEASLPPPVIAKPNLVVVPGTIQSVLGCDGDWQPDCELTALTFDEESQVWRGEFTIPAGEYEYKVAIDGGWDVNFGQNAAPGGANILLALEEETAVSFFFDHKTGWVTDSVNTTITTVFGDFQSELGCSEDWSPGCMAGWVQDPDGDGNFVFQTLSIPAGDYEVQAALNRSWDNVIGEAGEAGGPPIKFNVPEDNSLTTFNFDSNTNVLTVFTGGGGIKGNIAEPTAFWVAERLILWDVSHELGHQYFFNYDPAGGTFSNGLDGVDSAEAVPLTILEGGVPDDVAQKFPHLANLTPLAFPDDVRIARTALKGQIAVSAKDEAGVPLNAAGLQIPGVIDDLYPYDGSLGVSIEGGAPVIRVWAPTARQVRFHLFSTSQTEFSDTVEIMQVNPRTGVWTIEGDPDWIGKFYLFEVEVFVPAEGQVVNNIVTDPYSLSLSINSGRSQIVDMQSVELMPDGWQLVEKPALDAPEDMIVYELHVRDFSVNDDSVEDEFKGTFMAFAQTESNGMQHLAALAEAGMTHLHLLPTFDIATIDEDKNNWTGPTFADLSGFSADGEDQQALISELRDQDPFNWGYDPFHYNVPEGSYSTDPDGSDRIIEFRQMVQSVNEIGLRVVIDVVYNHTNASGQSSKSVLDQIVPGYYHRLDGNGRVERSTCCENTATEHDMMRKLMIDSVVLWATEYKIDGFRFDLMGHHMRDDMLAVRAALDALTIEEHGVDGQRIVVYGEGWNFGEVADNARGINATQNNMAGTGIGTFNDRLRDAARGGSPFGGQIEQGFINGLGTNPNSFDQGPESLQMTRLGGFMDLMRIGLAGNLRDYRFINFQGTEVSGIGVDYNGSAAGYTEDPQENIVYVSKHDNETLFDIIQYKAPTETSTADRARMQTMGNSIVLLSQGIPFTQAGDDLLRSKSLDRNSYNSGDWFNRLDFTYQSNNFGIGLPPAADNQGVWDIMSGILANSTLVPTPDDIAYARDTFREFLQIRQSSPLFRLQTKEDVINRLQFHNTGPEQLPGLIVMSISDVAGADLDTDLDGIIVLFNATSEQIVFELPDAANLPYDHHPVQANSVDPLLGEVSFEFESGTFVVPKLTTAVFTLPQGTVVESIAEQEQEAPAEAEAIEEEVAESTEEAMEEEAVAELTDEPEEEEPADEESTAEEASTEVVSEGPTPESGGNAGLIAGIIGALGLAGAGAYAYSRRQK